MIGFLTVLVLSIATICVQSTSSDQVIAEKEAATARLGNSEQKLDRLPPIEELLRKLDLAAKRSDIQPFDSPIKCNVQWYVEPGQKLLPGQVLFRIVPRRGRMIVPRFRPGALILDKIDGKLQRN